MKEANNLKKYIFTFGSNQLPELRHQLNPMDVMLVVEAEDEGEAREKVFESFIGERFCTSYPYSYKEEFIEKYNMYEITLNELITLKDK